jgi:rhamnopyranosyl-N-acetylglucosaminyl-diphospho-decaprenol beta-1,3/1,4-galactofuranosyltransferase
MACRKMLEVSDQAMKEKLVIAAVFATMNRAATASACVKALAAQSCPPDFVFVADNCSTDDTLFVLYELLNLPFSLVIHSMPENLGNAGGVKAVMEMAFARGADAVWILDDDSWPREKALACLLEKEWDPSVVRHALQIDPKTGLFTWPLLIDDLKGGWRLVWNETEFPEGLSVRSRITWTGALLSKEVHAAVGPVNGELFIRGEDEEYPWRIEQAGFSQEAIRGALMDHPGPENLIQWSVFGKNFFFERSLADWKLYYKVRNMVWLKRQQHGILKAIMIAGLYTLSACWFDGLYRIPILLKAITNGWNSKLGKLTA